MSDPLAGAVPLPAAEEEAHHISTALSLEQLDTNLFRSKDLWTPAWARGVFGGQVISQALLAATNSVNPKYAAHSLHCYFLLAAKASVPIIYTVDRVREGRTYATRAVRAVQNGHTVFVLMCSFQIPEIAQPAAYRVMPSNIVPPDECELLEDLFARLAEALPTGTRHHAKLVDYAKDRRQSPIAIKPAQKIATLTGFSDPAAPMWWMKARNLPKLDAQYQKCILAYLSDLQFISTTIRMLNASTEGEDYRASMTSSLDHSIWFYGDDFDCGEWLLYAMQSPRVGFGRGVVHGQIFTQKGVLVAVTTQEGVARVYLPDEAGGLAHRSKL
ncbi:hypothetical protein BOTBODRAFT_124210 [Botryobasidium botryosum FD-172 SS1]|uniref:Acyl-CoA thioesterase II domain-containing protein n=1 Tax=Botryobasidium botryosum (strain FD-172 SS1) TaxID=930990 RepID=A0A067MXS9_BOTB1|nr:hypothetical protein BOTBODRAFT_124210 [Botryobasidium botryosum FD-172 SS1]